MTMRRSNRDSNPESRRAFLRRTASSLTATSLAPFLPATAGALTSPVAGPAPVNEIRDPTTQIRIGVFDPAFRDLTLEQLIELITEFKIEAVELASGNQV